MSLATHRGWALTLSAFLVVVGLALVPATWIRWAFGIDGFRGGSETLTQDAPPPKFLQLLPAGRVPPLTPPDFDRIRIEIPRPPVVTPEPEDESPAEDDREEWTFDPTQAHGLARRFEEFEMGVAPPDSLQLARSILFREMSPGRWPAGLLVDNRDLTRAREQWAETDEWFRKVWGERWKAQGDSARSWDIYDRTVTDVERKGVQ